MQPIVTGFFHEPSQTVSYIVAEPNGHHCAVIDAVLDYDPGRGRTSTTAADAIVAVVQTRGLTVDWVLETHAHADHLSAAAYLKERLGGRLGIGVHICDIQEYWRRLYNAVGAVPPDGSQFDRLFEEGDVIEVGAMSGTVWHTPGHTACDVTYLFGDAAFVGDTLFMPDYGTARADFPGGDARTLYRSIQRIQSLPDGTRIFSGHDYLPKSGRTEHAWQSTAAAQRSSNVHVHGGVSEDAFVALRTARDRTLTPPQLLLPALQVNIRGGRLPEPEDNGRSYLKIPLNTI
jgi:glyoxylase-like metal-dependent hydrolase (beta-lactamase superfamily II)